jgi:biopolymer transport protein ExbB
VIATALMIVANDIHARLRRLRDTTERQLHGVIEIIEDLEARSGRPAPRTGSGTVRAVLPR